MYIDKRRIKDDHQVTITEEEALRLKDQTHMSFTSPWKLKLSC